jgi:hypothetical protein
MKKLLISLSILPLEAAAIAFIPESEDSVSAAGAGSGGGW